VRIDTFSRARQTIRVRTCSTMADIVDKMLDDVWLRKGVNVTCSTAKSASESTLESFLEIELSKDVNLYQAGVRESRLT
jgi:predicted TIM-barrel enzyme